MFNYATGVLSDPAGLLVFALAFWFTLERAWARLLATLCVGVFVRDASLLAALPAWIVLYLDSRERPGRRVLIGVGLVLLPLVLYVVLRREVDLALGGSPYVWKVGVRRLMSNVARPVSLATCAAALGPAFAILLMRRRVVSAWWTTTERRVRALIVASLLTNAGLVVYSSLSAFLSGRFVWPAYVPLALLVAVALSESAEEAPRATGASCHDRL